MSNQQRESFCRLVAELMTFDEFHHGACVGADADAVGIVAEFGIDPKTLEIIAHPGPKSSTLQSLSALDMSGTILADKPYLERNHDIVDACDLLIACPKGTEAELRSGTWATIRYARRIGKPVKVIHPDGSVDTLEG